MTSHTFWTRKVQTIIERFEFSQGFDSFLISHKNITLKMVLKSQNVKCGLLIIYKYII